jgi:tetratricopeptide (TPR) repeat protein
MSKSELKEAQKLIKSENYASALDLLQNLSTEDSYQSLLLLAFVHNKLKDYTLQLQVLHRALRILEDNSQSIHAHKGVLKIYPELTKISEIDDLKLFLDSFKACEVDLFTSSEYTFDGLVEKVSKTDILFRSVPVFLDSGFSQENLAKTRFFQYIPIHAVFEESIGMDKNSGMVCKVKNKDLGELLYLSSLNDRVKTIQFLQKARRNVTEDGWFDDLRSKLVPLSEYEEDLIRGGYKSDDTVVIKARNPPDSMGDVRLLVQEAKKIDDRTEIENLLDLLENSSKIVESVFEVYTKTNTLEYVRGILSEYYLFIDPQKSLLLTNSEHKKFQALFELNKHNEASEIFYNLNKTESPAWVNIIPELLNSKIESATNFTCYYSCIYAGRFHLSRNEFSLAKKPLLTAAKLRSGYWPAFSMLGFMYFCEKDYNRAEKCYRKALQLEPKADISGLIEILVEKESYAEVITLLEQAVERKSAKFENWAMFRLGLIKLVANDGDITNAIQYLQTALAKQLGGGNAEASQVYLALGDAYLLRGSYDSAKRCFNQLPDNTYAQVRLAFLQIQIGNFPEAEKLLLSINHKSENSALVKFTLAECYLLLAREARTQALSERLENCINKGLQVLTELKNCKIENHQLGSSNESPNIALSKKLKADLLYERGGCSNP